MKLVLDNTISPLPSLTQKLSLRLVVFLAGYLAIKLINSSSNIAILGRSCQDSHIIYRCDYHWKYI